MKSTKEEFSSHQRQQRILKVLRQHGLVRVQLLAGELGVSPMTIRRDLEILEQQGILERIHGGAKARERVAYEFSFKQKQIRCQEQKHRIGIACAKLVKPNDMVYLDTGTTALEIARCLLPLRLAAIITPNLCVVSEYLYQDKVRVFVPGGELNPLSPEVSGDWTCETLGKVRVDIAFLGADAVDLNSGIYSPDLKSASISRVMAERSERRFLVADSTKFGRRSRFKGAGLKDLTGIVTDRELPTRSRKILRSKGIKLVLA